VSPCEFLHPFAVLSRLDVLVRDEIVRDEKDPLSIKHPVQSDLLQLIHHQRKRDIVSHGDVDLHIDQISRFNLL
jgi:hypothetical protein